jgi:hypothetical protein
MSSRLNIVLVILLILAVTLVFLAPMVDLEPTALRAVRAAAMLFLAIVIAAHFFRGSYFIPILMAFGFCNRENLNPIQVDQPSLIDLYCSRLC